MHHPQGFDLKKTFKRLFEEPKGDPVEPRMLKHSGLFADVLKRFEQKMCESELADQKYFVHFHGKF